MVNRITTITRLFAAAIALLLAPCAGASLIAADGTGDEIFVTLNIFDLTSMPTNVFDQSVEVSNTVELERTMAAVSGGRDPLYVSLDITADGFLLTMACDGPTILPQGCELPWERMGVGFELTLSGLDWLDTPGELLGVDIVTGGGFSAGQDNVTVQNETVTSSSYSATFSESFLGTGSADSGTVTGTFLVRHGVPEPTTYLLVFLGLAMLVVGRRPSFWQARAAPAGNLNRSAFGAGGGPAVRTRAGAHVCLRAAGSRSRS